MTAFVRSAGAGTRRRPLTDILPKALCPVDNARPRGPGHRRVRPLTPRIAVNVHRGELDPLYRIRKLLLAGDERLDDPGRNRMLLGLRVGDSHDEVLGAWLAKGRCATSRPSFGTSAARENC